MSNLNSDFSRILLKECRADAKRLKVKIPRMTTSKCTGFLNPFFSVWGPSGLLWQGNANDGWDAKAKCIEKLIKSLED